MNLTTISEVRRPSSIADVDGWRDGYSWLAGGTWLFSEPQPALSRLLDLHAYRWPSLRVQPDGLEIAATCTLAELARAELPPWPAASLIGHCCAALLGSVKVWNAATVGGNICLSLPAGPMISLTAALDGMCTILAPGGSERRIPVAEFVTGPSQNGFPAAVALAAGPLGGGGDRAAFPAGRDPRAHADRRHDPARPAPVRHGARAGRAARRAGRGGAALPR
jgi:CO/xanthine dehydrogenase FAD-binding subunit